MERFYAERVQLKGSKVGTNMDHWKTNLDILDRILFAKVYQGGYQLNHIESLG